MCLGVPGQVVSVDGMVAVVDFFGIRRETRLDVVDEPVEAGDYVLNHVGFAIRKIPAEEIAETLGLYEVLLREAGEDMMAADVRGEIEAVRAATGGPGAGLGGLVGDGPGDAFRSGPVDEGGEASFIPGIGEEPRDG